MDMGEERSSKYHVYKSVHDTQKSNCSKVKCYGRCIRPKSIIYRVYSFIHNKMKVLQKLDSIMLSYKEQT